MAVANQAATLNNVATSTTAAPVFPASGSARVRTVWNDSAAVLYLAFAGTASATNCTVAVAAGGYYEFPQMVFAGAVSGVLASGTGTARTTEY